MGDAAAVPSIDVVIAVRNEERMLDHCLESVLAQEFPQGKIRVIVVDNGSTDRTRDIAAKFPVNLLIESRAGAAAARNLGIDAGRGDLIGFLDAHCVVGSGWAAAMSGRFADTRVGGCQGFTELRALDERVARHIELTGMNEHDSLLDATLRGERNIYPWMLSGNCMLRRSVLGQLGGFDESLMACEDVDLSWRAVLSGYLLDYAECARVTHWNCDDWDAHVQKSRGQGRGAAVLADRYLPLGAENIFAPSYVPADPDAALIAFQYEAGYREEEQRGGEKLVTPAMRLPGVRSFLRAPFQWRGDDRIRISSDAVYWCRDDDRSVIVHHPTRSRFVLDDAADVIWRGVSAGENCESVAQAIVNRYDIPMATALTDCNDLVEQLIDSGVVIRDGQ
jgi:glycosyltransferase involved in cell wall biosynthesis